MLVWGRALASLLRAKPRGPVERSSTCSATNPTPQTQPRSTPTLQTLCNSSLISMQLIWCTGVYYAKRANKGSPIATRTEGSNLQQEEPPWLHTNVVLSPTSIP